MSETDFDRGFDYVKNAILRSGLSAIPRLRVEADNPFDFGDFERGMIAALRQVETRLGITEEI